MKPAYPIFLIGIIMIFMATTKPLLLVDQLTPEQQAGKKIYTTGVGATDVKIMANMSGVDVPATIMPCVNCHNPRGTGNPEGGIIPSNITWQYLTKDYEVKRQDGTKRPAYNDKSLRKVITTGFDPAGNQLHASMPRYKMSREDIDNLIAYIKVLGSDFDKGLSKTSIKLGFHLPDRNESTRNKAVKELVNAYVQKINSAKGIYNRKLEIEFLTKDLKNTNEVFMVTGFDQTRSSNYEGVPTLLSTPKKSSTRDDKNLFYIYPSHTSQNLSLVDYGNTLVAYRKNPPVIVYYKSRMHEPIANELKATIESKYKITPKLIEINTYNQKTVAENALLNSNQVIHFLGPFQIGNNLLRALDQTKKYPQIVLSGSVSGMDITRTPVNFQGRISIGYPTWVTTRSAEGLEVYRKLQKANNLSTRWRNLQYEALVMLMTLEKAFIQSGININREAFQKELEGFYEFSTGLMQPITFTPNKHVGSTITYVLGFNAQKLRMEIKTMVNSGK